MGKDNLQPIPSLVIHKLSQAQYNREKEAGRLDPNAIYLTPNEYTLPTASADTLGGIKVGNNLTISNGVLSAKASGVGIVGSGMESVILNDSSNDASGDWSLAQGMRTTASGNQSHAEGWKTTASGDTSHAQGYSTTARGDFSHIEGNSSYKAADVTTSTTNSDIITAWGTKKFSLAKGEASHCEGEDCLALSDCSHVEGYRTITSSAFTHAEGDRTTASGQCSHAEGSRTTAKGYASHAEGLSSDRASDIIAITSSTTNDEIIAAWKTSNFTLAKDNAAHAEGDNCLALSPYSHAEGSRTIANGYASHAGGYCSEVNDWASFSHGSYTTAQGYAQTVFGKFNTLYSGATNSSDATGSIFIVGVGTGDTARANAFRITNAGQCMGSQSFATTGADYAEYYEWEDGNPNNEDRRGHFVTFAKGRKVRIANDTDAYILGVVSSTPSVIGNAYTDQWQGMYLTDVFGERLTEIVEVEEEEIKDDEGNVIETIPVHTETRFVINPDYDHTKPYAGRNERQEWAIIGTHGQLVLIDDGTCEEGDFCAVSEKGTATKSDSVTKYRVTERIDTTHIWVQIL